MNRHVCKKTGPAYCAREDNSRRSESFLSLAHDAQRQEQTPKPSHCGSKREDHFRDFIIKPATVEVPAVTTAAAWRGGWDEPPSRRLCKRTVLQQNQAPSLHPEHQACEANHRSATKVFLIRPSTQEGGICASNVVQTRANAGP